jgi:hypothetical protein
MPILLNPLDEKTKLELGLENRLMLQITFLTGISITFSDFDYKRNIVSAYANYGKQNEKWSYQLGARIGKF